MSDIKKVRDYKKARQPKPPISKAEHRANAENICDMLMPIIEQMRKSPETIQPVAESFDELLDQMRHGVVRQPVIVNRESGEEKKAVRASDLPTKNDTGGDELSGKSTDFTAEELAILETLK